MTPKPERESSVDMVGLDLPYRLSAFSPSDLNIKPSHWFAFVWCALHRDGSLSSHGSCFNQHGSHSAIYTIITTQSPPTRLTHAKSTCVWWARCVSPVLISPLIPPLMLLSAPTRFIWFFIVPPSLSCRLLSGMWGGLVLCYLYPCTHLYTRCLKAVSTPTWAGETTDPLRCVICQAQ